MSKILICVYVSTCVCRYIHKRVVIQIVCATTTIFDLLHYLVHNTLKNTTYNIDLDTGLCPCHEEILLGLCLPVTEEVRNKLHVIATGCSEIQDGWYSSTSEKITTDKCINVQHYHTEIEKENDQISQSNFITEIASYDNNVTKFNEMIENIKRSCLFDVEYFLPGMNNMVKLFDKNIKTHSSLLSAMMTFGKYSGIEPNSKRMNELVTNI
ncbi:hypothetical protein AGLY_017040 [Aphis glycines]|uniref:Uncharacterized protein n=1 Tax=Aphis glycines TaxID=307491 RepID=A0A6G0SW04_APHGL|nr:hypothetical protein AGLY_017040 [Aphis glycines]